MRMLAACECSGVVRDAFATRGHDAWSCDLLPSESPGNHIQCNVEDVLGEDWDLMIAFPPCTFLAGSGLHWNGRISGRQEQTDAALAFVRNLLNAPIHRIALENPVGCISTLIRPASQYIQPYDFGEDASKKTGLWLKNLPPLRRTNMVKGRFVIHNGKTVERWSNQTNGGQNKLGPSPLRAQDRARTYQGIADAMAEQWGSL